MSSVIFYAATEPLYNAAVDFYKSIGFSYSDNGVLTSDHANITIKLDPENAQSPEEIQHNIEVLKSTTKDWRTLQSTIVMHSIPENVVPLRSYPNNVNPTEVYTLDPLGTIIGFTNNDSAYSNIPHHKHVAISNTNASQMGNASITSVFTEQHHGGKNIAVMTSGGDAPGMNANVRAIVRTTLARDCNAFVIHEGYSGLVKGGPKFIKKMKWSDVDNWLMMGGTNIGTARCKEFRERSGRLAACKNMIEAGIDGLIVCGGDGSLTGADLFRQEWPSLIKELFEKNEITEHQFNTYQHLNICGTVGSIDNDMSSTDATIGAYSSLDRICKAIDYIVATANSHQRAFVVEVMGRNCGWLALMAGIATSADYIFIPEKPSKKSEWSESMCTIVSKHRQRGKRKTIIIVAEGAITSDLVPITCNDVKEALVSKLGIDTRVTTLGHVQRGGPPVAFDRFLATMQGVVAVDTILSSTPSTPSQMIAIAENKIVKRDLVDAVKLTKSVAEAIKAKDFQGAIDLRDNEFKDHLNYLMQINSADFVPPSLPPPQRKNYAIINVGAPAGGMNSAIYAFTNFCLSRGHTPYAIYNGFSGLARHESIHTIDWLNIEGWNSLGGSEIGTNRSTPNSVDIGKIAYYFTKYNIQGLVLVGGFEALESLQQLNAAKINYPAFQIPMVLLPSTISNNVPGTEYSLGSDTCVNQLIEYCDIISQSANSTRNRTFVVECQGGYCGYIASLAQLVTGSLAAYVPEEGISLEQLDKDIETLRALTAADKTHTGHILIKSEYASLALSTEKISEIVQEESQGMFDSRVAIPGHVQQGGLPSPIDRIRATRFAIKAVEYMESLDTAVIDESSAVVLGIEGSKVHFKPVESVWNEETVYGKRGRKMVFWDKIKSVADMLVGRQVV